MIINMTNHPSTIWSREQRTEAEKYGEILDMPFPVVPPDMGEEGVSDMAETFLRQILPLHPDAVLCQGEMTLTYALVSRLAAQGIPVLAACSDRITEETAEPDGSIRRVSRFVFTRFRQYRP